MRRLTATIVGTCAVAAGGLVAIGIASPAHADCPPDPVNSKGICLSTTVPGDPSDEDPGDEGGDEGGDSNAGCQDPSGKAIPCTNEFGYTWLAAHNCYGFKVDPQPPAGDPMWEGHDPSEGSVWSCDPTVSIDENTWFVATDEEPRVDAGQVARDLLAQAPFEVAEVHTAPATPDKTYVGLETWLWIPNGQWHNVSASITVQGATVTLTATPSRMAWDMGDGGSSHSCASAGRAWVKGMDDNQTTTCSYAYNRLSTVTPSGKYDPERAFTVTGGLYYDVGWTCTGNCSAPNGDLGEYPAPTSSTELIVAERQSVVTR